MGYHKPTAPENILVGDKYEFNKTLRIAEDFSKFIVQKTLELREFDSKELGEHGISLEYGRTTSDITFIGDNTKLTISHNCSKNNTSFSAAWAAHTPQIELLRRLTDERVPEYIPTMSFNTTITNVGNGYYTIAISFGSDKPRNDGDIEHYIDGYYPHPYEKIIYDEEYGRYNPMYKNIESRPVLKKIPINGKITPTYINPDGTPLVTEPVIVTTCRSFDDARSEMVLKIDAFKNAIERILNELNDGKEKEKRKDQDN